MANRTTTGRGGSCGRKSKGKSRTKYTSQETLAYNLGRIQASIDSRHDSKVRTSYENGLKAKDRTSNKKPLF